jgi:probable HAF family extracellular repeat protein
MASRRQRQMKPYILSAALTLALSGAVPGLIAATAAPASAATTTYTMTDLGNLGGGVSMGFGINASGEVVGRSFLNKVFTFRCGRHTCKSTQNDPFSWTAGKMTDLGTLNAMAESEANAVNSAGDVVGGSNREAILAENGTLTDLGQGEATGINDSGQIVGYNLSGAFLVSNGTTTELPNLSSANPITSATGINDSGQAVGTSDNASGWSQAVMWSNGTITDLGTLGGPQSSALAVNGNGQVTGWAQTASDALHVFLWSNGTMTDLGTFGMDAVGNAINDHGVIVGQNSSVAWIWSGGVFQDLNSLIPAGSGFTLTSATAINDNGQIVANGINAGGQTHAFLLTPTS